MHAFIRHQAPISTIASILSLAIILCSAVSYAPRVASAFTFTSRSSKQLLPLCSTSATGRRSLAGVIAASSSLYSPSSKRTGSLFFTRQQTFIRGQTIARRMAAMSLSATTDVNSDTSLASFLTSIPETLPNTIKSSDENNDLSIQMIMGNEAGDADSIVSALGLGYVNSLTKDGDKGNLVQIVPIVSVSRADISLRRDVVLLLALAGIDVQSLLYIDDDIIANKLIPPQESTTSSTLQEASSLILVDHNRIRSSMSHLSSLVSEIVDHHEDEKSHGDVTFESGKRDIAFENGHATVASTCTLVAERLFDQMKQIGGGGNNSIILDGSLGLMLLGVILLDSVNMLPGAGKGTPRDQEAMDMLLKYTHWESIASTTPSLVDKHTLDKIFPNGQTNEPDKTALFEVLSGAKNDPKFWSDLSVTDCLRIDYKKFLVPDNHHQQQQSPLVSSIGLSSVLMDMNSFLAKDNFLEELEAFAISSDVGLFGVLTLKFEDGKANRELLLAGSDADIVDSFAEHLLEHSDAAFLEVSERNDCMSGHHNSAVSIRVFRQGNGKGSRKQVAPILLGHASEGS